MNEFTDRYLPVIILTGVIYLVKIGAFSGIVLAIKKLWDYLRSRKS